MVLRTLRIQVQPLALAIATIMELKTFCERIIFVHLLELRMESGLHYTKINLRKHLINENCSTLFHLQISPSVYDTRKNCKQFIWQS